MTRRTTHRIEIAKPCSADWNSMNTMKNGRFCSSCQKVVIDFSGQTDDQISAYLETAAGKEVCGRFRSSQLQRIRITIDPEAIHLPMLPWQRFLLVFLLCFGSDLFGVDFCFAQDTVPVPQEQPALPANVQPEDTLIADTSVAEAATLPDSVMVVAPQIVTVTPEPWFDLYRGEIVMMGAISIVDVAGPIQIEWDFPPFVADTFFKKEEVCVKPLVMDTHQLWKGTAVTKAEPVKTVRPRRRKKQEEHPPLLAVLPEPAGVRRSTGDDAS